MHPLTLNQYAGKKQFICYHSTNELGNSNPVSYINSTNQEKNDNFITTTAISPQSP
jgi:hypothetical protein